MCEEKGSLEERLVAILKEKNYRIATAESCTGGMVASTLINVAGISPYLKESYITYSDEAKQRILHVSAETLKTETAVSEKCAEEMVRGVTAVANAQVGISVTGIAGPGGSGEFPAGLVYIGSKVRDQVCVERYLFEGDRKSVRTQATEMALKQTLSLITSE
ncbi:MAG: CinA family protein [Roseburia sp.]